MNSAMLDDFCHGLTGGWTPQDRLQPPEVARKFVGFFGFSPSPAWERWSGYWRLRVSKRWRTPTWRRA